MSDFGELCPLFNTGVYHEVTLGPILSVSSIEATSNLLETKITAGLGLYGFSFGRTVVVTGAYIQRFATNNEVENLYLQHRSTIGAVATAIGSLTITNSITLNSSLTWQPMNIGVSSATFTSNEILGLGVGTITALTQGSFNLIVRYREK